jgi:hypothetical protein
MISQSIIGLSYTIKYKMYGGEFMKEVSSEFNFSSDYHCKEGSADQQM